MICKLQDTIKRISFKEVIAITFNGKNSNELLILRENLVWRTYSLAKVGLHNVIVSLNMNVLIR